MKPKHITRLWLITMAISVVLVSLALSAAPGYAALVEYWQMDETSGTTVADSSGSGYDGTSQRDTSLLHTDGAIGGALTFNGSSDIISISNSLHFASTQPRTISMWLFLPDIHPPSEPLFLYCDYMHNPGGYDNGWMFGAYDQSAYGPGDTLWVRIAASIDNGSYLIAESSEHTLITNEWQHIAMTWNGSGAYTGVKFYWNGDPLTTELVWGSVYGNGISTRPVTIGGADSAYYPDYYSHASLDDVRLYDTVLSSSDISGLYEAGAGGAAPEPATVVGLGLMVIAAGLRKLRRKA